MSQLQVIADNREVARHFFEKLVSRGPGCHEWVGAKLIPKRGGYGSFTCRTLGLHTVRAHRAAWVIYCGEVLPDHVHLLHSCDNVLCVNVEQLFKGDQASNMEDKFTKNRQNKGETHGRHKLTEVQARAIYSLKGTGVTAVSVATDFTTTDATVRDIWKHRSWRHLH